MSYVYIAIEFDVINMQPKHPFYKKVVAKN